MANSAKKDQVDPKAKVRNRGKVVFPANSSKVNDNKDHFPINDANQARNALSRVAQYSAVPKWFSGTLKELQSKVRTAVKSKYPKIQVTTDKKSKSSTPDSSGFRLMDYDEYEGLVKSEFSVMVTSPDPEDGHTHIVWINKKGNGMTSPYPEDDDSYRRHQHIVIAKEVIPFSNGYSLSFHGGLQDATQADLPLSAARRAKDREYGEAAAGLVGNGILDTHEKEVDGEISDSRKSLDEAMRKMLE